MILLLRIIRAFLLAGSVIVALFGLVVLYYIGWVMADALTFGAAAYIAYTLYKLPEQDKK